MTRQIWEVTIKQPKTVSCIWVEGETVEEALRQCKRVHGLEILEMVENHGKYRVKFEGSITAWISKLAPRSSGKIEPK